MNVWQIIKREIKEIFIQDPRRIIFVFGAILLYLFLFGFLYGPGVVKHIPTLICDEDQSHLSRELIRNLEDNESLDIQQEVSSEEELQQALMNKEVYAAIQIPKNFSKDITQGHSTTVLYMVNGSNLVFANTTSLAVQDTVNECSDKLAAHYASLRLGMDESILKKEITPVHYNLRVINNPTQTYLLFFCIGLAMTAYEQGLFFAIGASVHYDFNHWTELENTSLHTLLFGKILIHWLFSMIAFAGFLFFSGYTWNIPIKASFLKLFSLTGAFCFAVLLLGMLTSALFSTELKYVKASLLYVVPAFILSGYTWPLESMPFYIQWMAKIFFPLTWIASAMRDLLLSGTTRYLPESIIALLTMGVCCLLFVKKIFKYGCNSHLLKKYE